MTPEQLVFTLVTERDMDLLVVEELKCSAAFRSWLLSKLPSEHNLQRFLAPEAAVAVRHSVERSGDGYGETDIEVTFTLSGPPPERLVLFIEDKITAAFTPNQPQRYKLAAEAARRAGRVEIAVCMLLAPEQYIARCGSALFDACVPYEAMAEHFIDRLPSTSGELRERLRHRVEIVEHAVGKFRRGYEVIADPSNTNFWKAYHALATKVAPELQLDDPGQKPTYSIDVYFKRALPLLGSLRKAWLLKHSLENAVVMIEISQWGVRYDRLAPLLGRAVEPGMTLRQAGKSVQIRLPVPNLDTSKPFSGQQEAVVAGLEAMKRLRTWYLKQHALIDDCQRIAE